MNAKRVLAALDQSSQAPMVFEQALEQATNEGSKLLLMHVRRLETRIEANPLIGIGTLADTQMYGVLQRLKQEEMNKAIETAQSWMRPYQHQAIENGISTEMVCTIGEPGVNLCDYARDWKADLIVIGRRGHHGIREVVLGSVSNYVIHHAPCSVLVVQKQFSERINPLDSSN